jgi:hypothetical protein
VSTLEQLAVNRVAELQLSPLNEAARSEEAATTPIGPRFATGAGFSFIRLMRRVIEGTVLRAPPA